VYAFHNLGGGDASKLLKAMRDTPGMSVRDALLAGTQDAKEIARVDSVIKGNKSLYGDGSISAQQAYGRMGDAMKGGEVFARKPARRRGRYRLPRLSQLASAQQRHSGPNLPCRLRYRRNCHRLQRCLRP
jgi:hypothetical protein